MKNDFGGKCHILVTRGKPRDIWFPGGHVHPTINGKSDSLCMGELLLLL